MRAFSGLGSPVTILSNNAFGASHHPRRLKALFTEILAYDPDIICLQEIITAKQLGLVAAAFADYEVYHIPGTAWPVTFVAGGLVTLVRRTRLVVESRQFIPFSTQSTLLSPFTLGDGQLRKGYLVLRIHDALTNRWFDIYNTHLVAHYGWHAGAEATLHQKQLAELMRRIRFSLPQIFCGDLNMTPDAIAPDSPLRELGEAFNFCSSICTVDNKENSLRQGLRARLRGCGDPTLRKRVDYLLHHGFRAGGERLCFTRRVQYDDYVGHVSDHFGIYLPLEFA